MYLCHYHYKTSYKIISKKYGRHTWHTWGSPYVGQSSKSIWSCPCNMVLHWETGFWWGKFQVDLYGSTSQSAFRTCTKISHPFLAQKECLAESSCKHMTSVIQRERFPILKIVEGLSLVNYGCWCEWGIINSRLEGLVYISWFITVCHLDVPSSKLATRL